MFVKKCWLFLLTIPVLGNPVYVEQTGDLPTQQVQFAVKIMEVQIDPQRLGFGWSSSNSVFPGPIRTPSVGGEPVNSDSQPVATITGIMTDPQFRTVIRALEQSGTSRALAELNGSTLVGNPITMQRADGWLIKIVPLNVLRNQTVIFSYEIQKKQGDYAGFSLSSEARVLSGQSATFLDDYIVAEKDKKKSMKKRLIVTLTPITVPPADPKGAEGEKPAAR